LSLFIYIFRKQKQAQIPELPQIESNRSLVDVDAEVFRLTQREKIRQVEGLELIASEVGYFASLSHLVFRWVVTVTASS